MARPGLDKHSKFRLLVRLLGEPRPHVRGYLEYIWEVAYECGDPVIGTPEAIEAAAEYPGEAGKLFKALLQAGGGSRAGFIEPVKEQDGMFQVHDLFDHAPEYVKKRKHREEERKSGGRSQTTADNGGQRRTLDDNGETPSPPPSPAPAPMKIRNTFAPPTVEEVRSYCHDRGLANVIDPEMFVSFYQGKGWMVGKSPMKDWRACVRTWERSEAKKTQQPKSPRIVSAAEVNRRGMNPLTGELAPDQSQG